MTASFDYEIQTDGRVVWVNAGDGCIARFGLNGIDIHHFPMSEESQKTECLFCTHEKTNKKGHWDLFVEKMQELYDIAIPSHFLPERFR